jgi:hypothetical protein
MLICTFIKGRKLKIVYLELKWDSMNLNNSLETGQSIVSSVWNVVSLDSRFRAKKCIYEMNTGTNIVYDCRCSLLQSSRKRLLNNLYKVPEELLELETRTNTRGHGYKLKNCVVTHPCDKISSRFESPTCGPASLIASLTLRVWTPSKTDETKLCRSICSVFKCLANYGPGNKSSSYLNQSSVMERSGSNRRIPSESSYEKFKNREQAIGLFLQCRHFYSILS